MDGTLNSISPPARDPAYLAELQRRRDSLHAQLQRILPPSSTFIWELGCGHGHFLTAYAYAHPDQLCIGIDLVSERILRALRKRERARLDNLFFVHAAAGLFLEMLPAGVSFSELFLLFPDPWPKMRHHKHRIVQPEFLTRAARRAARNARLCFRTDSAPYAADTRRVLHSHPHWQLSSEEWPFESGTVFQNRAASYQSLVARRAPDGDRL
jgi:tRNA (guanine-N7-)-methyltransferase